MRRILLIKGGTIWTESGPVHGDLLLDMDGRVAEIVDRSRTTGSVSSPLAHLSVRSRSSTRRDCGCCQGRSMSTFISGSRD